MNESGKWLLSANILVGIAGILSFICFKVDIPVIGLLALFVFALATLTGVVSLILMTTEGG